MATEMVFLLGSCLGYLRVAWWAPLLVQSLVTRMAQMLENLWGQLKESHLEFQKAHLKGSSWDFGLGSLKGPLLVLVWDLRLDLMRGIV